MFNRKLTFVVGLTTRTGDAIPREDAIAQINYTFSRMGLDGFSIVDQVGYWKGVQEQSLSASCYIDQVEARLVDNANIDYVARELAALCQQDVVLWAIEPVTTGGLAFGGQYYPQVAA